VPGRKWSAAAEAALRELPRLAAELDIPSPVAQRAARDHRELLDIARASHPTHEGASAWAGLRGANQALRLALIDQERDAVLALRDSRTIDDTTLLGLQSHYDALEMALVPPEFE
jgi:hypothetical protein